MEKQREIPFTKLKPSDMKLCCCCQEILTSTSMWQIGEADEESYGQMLQVCFSIELDSEVDDVICAGCVSQLQAAVEFKCKVTNCQKKLKLTFIDTNKQLIFEEIKPWPNIVKQEIDDNELDINQYIDNDYDVTLEPDNFHEPLKTKEVKEIKIEEIKSEYNNEEPPKKKYTVNQDDFEKIDKKYVCKKCNKTLSDYRSVIRHLNNVHYKTPTCSCSECGEQFISQIKLTRHKVKVHNIGERPSIVPSKACGKKFKSGEQYETHKSECSEAIAKLCSLGILKNCSVPLKKLETTEKILKAKYFCGSCPEEFPNESALARHMRTHSRDNKTVQLPPAKQPNEKLSSRYKVFPEDYTKVGKKYSCNKCNKILSYFNAIARHINSVHYRNPLHSCDKCDGKFSTLNKLNEHKFVAHNIDLRVTCKACDKKFWCARTLDQHTRYYHRLGNPKRCPHCDYVTYNSIGDHMSKHTTIAKYQCRYCPKVFKRHDSHKYHERIHTGDKRMVCKICDARFVQRSSLKYHIMKSHPNEPTA